MNKTPGKKIGRYNKQSSSWTHLCQPQHSRKLLTILSTAEVAESCIKKVGGELRRV